MLWVLRRTTCILIRRLNEMVFLSTQIQNVMGKNILCSKLLFILTNDPGLTASPQAKGEVTSSMGYREKFEKLGRSDQSLASKE